MIKRSLLLLFIGILSISCSRIVTTVTDVGLKDNAYDRVFFQVEKNNKLDELVRSVKMVNCLAYYENFIFSKMDAITISKFKNDNFQKSNFKKTHHTETASGTATIIYSDGNKVALLTAAHVLNFPDTLIVFHKNSGGLNSNHIESISIKTRQTNFLPEFKSSNEIKILSIDPLSDIAIIGKKISPLEAHDYIPFGISLGNSDELSWGTKIFIIGYPLNNKMITDGIVSPSQTKNQDYFFADAVFNRGFSGGVVLAVRDGAPNFEMVGMVKSGTVHRQFVLTPDTDNPDFIYTPNIPYSGKSLVEEKQNIKYGITKIMTVEKIRGFLDDHERELEDLDYNINIFFNN